MLSGQLWHRFSGIEQFHGLGFELASVSFVVLYFLF